MFGGVEGLGQAQEVEGGIALDLFAALALDPGLAAANDDEVVAAAFPAGARGIDGDLGLYDEQKDLISRLCKIMDWPVAQLMTLSLAIATDFDSVYRAWKKYHDERGHGLFDANNDFMLTSARTIVMTGHPENDGYADQLQGHMASIKLAMDLVWRSLGVWATVLAILLLVNVIA